MKRKKKISLITIFDNPNFGTYLQALALSLALEKKDNKVEIVRYMRPIWHNPSKLRRKLRVLEPLLENIRILIGSKYLKQRKGCRDFVSKYISLSKIYYSFDELKSNPPKADIYLTGSDQVWNTIHNHGIDKSFYLGYVPESVPKYAYAASVGMNYIPDEYKEETKALLSQYKAISVREQSNIALLESIGIKSEMVLDPTLLLTSEEWKKKAKIMNLSEPYVLVYSVESKERDKQVGEIAQLIAKAKKYKVYEVSYDGKERSILGCDRHFYYATPDVFLALITNADFIVGSSFHITAFAINFNIDFISVAPDRFSSRIDNLLSMTGLLKRKISDSASFDNSYLEECDFTQANDFLNKERIKSNKFLEKISLSE